MLFKQIASSLLTKTPKSKALLALPQRAFMVKPKPLLAGLAMLRPTLMAFGTNPRMSAADTPATHMHRTLALDKSITSFFEKQTGKALSLSALTRFMDESLLRGPMSFSEH